MLSVIVTVYNCEKYIEKCLNSIINQLINDFEIVVIDDGSTDNSYDLIEKLAKEDSRITVIRKKNGGILSARLEGVRFAGGDIIGFVDGDDYIDETMFCDLSNIMSDSTIDMISSGIIKEFDNGTKMEIWDRFTPGIYSDLEKDIYPTMLWDYSADEFGLYCNLVNKLFRKEKLLEILEEIPKDITYGEDAAVFYSYMMKCKKICITHGLYYHYCIRNGSMCNSKDERLHFNDYILYKWLYSAFERSEKKDDLLQQLKQYILMIERHRITTLYDIHPSLLNNWEFYISDEQLDEPFIIYGAGGCGQAFFRYIKIHGKQNNIVAWVDRDYKAELIRCNYPLFSIEDGLSREYGRIIIAIKNVELQEIIKSTLVKDYNVLPEKILLLRSKELIV